MGYLEWEEYYSAKHSQSMTADQIRATYELFKLFCRRRTQEGTWYYDAAYRYARLGNLDHDLVSLSVI